MLFRVSDIHKSFGGHEILRGVSFQVNPGEKIGLVGRNGAGKSTIFRIISGNESPDSGFVTIAGRLKFGLLEQHIDFEDGETVHTAALQAFQELHDIEAEMRELEVLLESDPGDALLDRYAELQTDFERKGGFAHTARAEAVLLGLGFSKSDWLLETGMLSGGQKNRLGLARLLLSEADVLLLDEPTNHLDVQAVEWLEDYLRAETKAFVVISHDRYFLDRTCKRIIEVERGRLYSFTGNYSGFMAQSAMRKEQQKREYENQRALIDKTEAFIRKNLAGQKTKQAKSRRNMLERMKRVEAPSGDTGGGNFRLKEVKRTGAQVLSLEDLSIGYGGNTLAEKLDLVLLRGESLGVVGGNGTGKTTFLKTILGSIPALSGKITWGTKTELGYYSQQLEELEGSNEVLAELRSVAPLAQNGELRSFLARFLFLGDDVFKRVSDLSGGEKGRLSLAKLIYSNANVLLLDEPTNHLDIPSREALESALLDYKGTIIVVSHDRFLLDRLADRILDFRGGGGFELFSGNYSEYHRWLGSKDDAGDKRASDSGNAPSALRKGEKTPQKGAPLSKNEVRRIEMRIAEIETQIPGLEEKLKSISFQMSKPENASERGGFQKLSRKFDETESAIKKIYAEWEALEKKID